MPSPQAEDQQRRKRQKAGETEPALCPVHIDHDGFDLNREDAVAHGAFVTDTGGMFSPGELGARREQHTVTAGLGKKARGGSSE